MSEVEKHPGGRPLLFETPEDLQNAVDLYFLTCDSPDKPQPKSVCGLALALGFVDRQSIYDYEKRPQFSCIIKRALLMVEENYEIMASHSKNAAGPIFILKNMGWKDRVEQELSGSLQVVRVELPQKKEIGAPVDI
ncbi:MAG: terminase small subunit [Candidatus Marinimicrobia bacterium]|nr:terminase small subunit [Candidatus Neomarinimicrobiota bacterium]